MKKQLVTINLKKVNVVAFVMLIIPMIISISLQVTILKGVNTKIRLWDFIIMLLAYPILIIAHEGVHALTFILTGAPKGSVRFGAIPKKFMVYCTTSKPMSVKSYEVSLVTPLIFTGIIPWVVATVFLNPVYSILFAGMISGAAGDVMMLLELKKHKEATLILDHPKAPAFYLMYEDDKTPPDFKEVTEEDEEKLLNQLK